jgi:hypothetical protein
VTVVSPAPAVQAVLKQGYRNNWQQYLAALNGEHGVLRGWDLVVLTASNRSKVSRAGSTEAL